MLHRLKAIICDVDGTLYCQTPVRRVMARRLASFCLLSPFQGMKTVRTLRAYRQAQESIRRQSIPNACMQAAWAARRLGYPISWVSECVEEWMENQPLPWIAKARFAGLIETLDWARNSGIKLGIVSDYRSDNKLRAMEIEHYFSTAVSAMDSEVQRFKPDPTGLRVALERLQAEPSEALYVGDRLDVDYPAAAAIGMECCIVSARSQVIRKEGLTVLPAWSEVLDWLKSRGNF